VFINNFCVILYPFPLSSPCSPCQIEALIVILVIAFGVKTSFISSKDKSVNCNLDEVQALNTAKLSLTL